MDSPCTSSKLVAPAPFSKMLLLVPWHLTPPPPQLLLQIHLMIQDITYLLNFHGWLLKTETIRLWAAQSCDQASCLNVCADLVASPSFQTSGVLCLRGIAQLGCVQFMSEEPCCWWMSHSAFASALPLCHFPFNSGSLGTALFSSVSEWLASNSLFSSLATSYSSYFSIPVTQTHTHTHPGLTGQWQQRQENSFNRSALCSVCWKHELEQESVNCGQCFIDTENLTSLNVSSLLLLHPLSVQSLNSAHQYDYWYYFLHGCWF